jgi:hypothetical protein
MGGLVLVLVLVLVLMLILGIFLPLRDLGQIAQS